MDLEELNKLLKAKQEIDSRIYELKNGKKPLGIWRSASPWEDDYSDQRQHGNNNTGNSK